MITGPVKGEISNSNLQSCMIFPKTTNHIIEQIPLDKKSIVAVGRGYLQIMAQPEVSSYQTLFVGGKQIIRFNPNDQSPGFDGFQCPFDSPSTPTYIVTVHSSGEIVIGLSIKPFGQFLALVLLVSTCSEIGQFFRIILLGLIEGLIIPVGQHRNGP